MKRLLIRGGTIVNEGRRFLGYVLVNDGIIAEVGEGEYPRADHFSGEMIDADGKIVMPGVIDVHVHFREPGLTEKGDMATESAAAVAGGVTSVLEMPNTVPVTTSMDALERKMELAEGRMHTNYSFFLGATNDNLTEVKKFNFYDAPGVKLFIGSSTGGMLVDSEKTISALFAEFGGVISAHCEDEAIIRANTDIYRREYGDRATAAIHPLVRSEEACYRATARAVELADKYGAKLHVAHLTTARELSLFSAGDAGAKRITAEACVPHLWFSDEDYARLGNKIKCNPSIKSPADRDALRAALGDAENRDALQAAKQGGVFAADTGDVSSRAGGKIDLVATDHAPHTAAEKSRGYWDAPSGIPSVQHSLPVMMELAAKGVLTLEGLVEKMCHAPAVRFGIAGRGFLRAGYKADITIVDPAAKSSDGTAGRVVAPENILYKCGWSPWEGVRFSSRVVRTIVGGRTAWDGERVTPEPTGERLSF